MTTTHPQRGRAAIITLLCLSMLLAGFVPASDAPLRPRQDAAEEDATVPMAWFNLQLALVQATPGFSPPVASRAFGYSGVALYEALAPGMAGYQSLVGQLNELEEVPQPDAEAAYHWPTVANSALATITRALFANASEENMAALDALEDDFASEFAAQLDEDVFDRSVDYGAAVAEAIFAWSMTDGGHEGYNRSFSDDYVPPEGDGLWVPTPRLNGDPQPALQPYWGDNRPFVLESGATCMPAAPPDYSEDPDSQFYQEVLEVYEADQNLTAEQQEIAIFWADNPGETATPPGHSIAIVTQILALEEATLAQAAEAYAKLGIAVADAFIGCWYAKYEYNLVRPVTFIRQFIDADWMPRVSTPPFPEYPSGHSVQTGAAAAVLADLFGEEYAFTDHTHDALGLAPRSFETFSELAEETALSRLYGGIHFRSAIELGLEQGHCIAEQVNALHFHQDDETDADAN